MGKKGGRTLNPMDQFRREQHRKEVKKNKKDRAKAREVTTALRDTTTADEVYELEKLEEQGKLDKEEIKKLRLLQEKLEKINVIRAAHGAKALQRPSEVEPADDTSGPNPLSVIPPGRDPKRSIYYDPILNPYGAPPPGQPYMEYPPEVMPYATDEAASVMEGKDGGGHENVEEPGSDEGSDSESSSGSSDSESDQEMDSDDEDWMPPLPEGPPPSMEDQARFLAPSLPKPMLRRVCLSDHPLELDLQDTFHQATRTPRGGPPPQPAQGDNKQQQRQPPDNKEQEREAKRRKAEGAEEGGESTSMEVDEQSTEKAVEEGVAGDEADHENPTTATTSAPSTQAAKPKVHPLPPKPGTHPAPATSSPSSSSPSTSVSSSPRPSKPTTPSAPAGPTSISAAPKLRNLQRELVHLVPSTILRKKVLQSKRIGKPVNAAPGIADDDEEEEERAGQQERSPATTVTTTTTAAVHATSPSTTATATPYTTTTPSSASITTTMPSGPHLARPTIPALASTLAATLTGRPLVNAAPDNDDESDDEAAAPRSGGVSTLSAGLGIRLPQINLTPSVTIGSARITINSAPNVDSSTTVAATSSSAATAPPAVDRQAKKKADYDQFLQSLEGDGLL
ncbi:hypothetical protein BGZ73_002653 [Actinomortierella ambigua]|nr:hypothetical protein BGZ73_002653 [Actinomortierella ambigua]